MSARASYPPPDTAPIASRALVIGLAGAAATAAGAFLDPAQFFRSYLVGYMLVVGVAVGCLAISMLHHMTRGAWGLVIRRQLEAASRTIPAVAVFFLPILLGLPRLYSWARPEAVAANPELKHQAVYFEPRFFIARAVLYFAVWAGFAVVLNRLSRRQDETGDPALERAMQRVAAGGLVVYALTMTFAAFDWLMSVNPHWASTIYGMYVVAGQAVAALAFTILVALWLSRREPMSHVLQARHFHDYGKLLLAFVMLWAYFAVSQLIIIWSGDLPEEIGFYRLRLAPGWKAVGTVLLLFHFALPFVLLLSRDLKRDARRLAPVAILLLVMRWLDLYWLVAPVFHPSGFTLHWLDVAAPVGLGGLWLWLYARELRGRELLPVNDPNLPAALEAVPHHG